MFKCDATTGDGVNDYVIDTNSDKCVVKVIEVGTCGGLDGLIGFTGSTNDAYEIKTNITYGIANDKYYKEWNDGVGDYVPSTNSGWTYGTETANTCTYTCKIGYTEKDGVCEMDGVCGNGGVTSPATASYLEPESTTLCTSGTAGIVNEDNGKWKWSCEGINGGNNNDCEVSIATCNSSTPPLNGSVVDLGDGTPTVYPTSVNQDLQGDDSTKACYIKCNPGYSWNSLSSSCE